MKNTERGSEGPIEREFPLAVTENFHGNRSRTKAVCFRLKRAAGRLGNAESRSSRREKGIGIAMDDQSKINPLTESRVES